MEVKKIREDARSLEIEISKEDHTIGNFLRTALLADRRVKYAGYQIVHPLTGGIRLTIHTDGEIKPRDALLEALSKLESETVEFREKFSKAVA